MNNGIINFPTQLQLFLHFYKICLMMHGSMNVNQRLNIAYCKIALNRIYDQPDDGLEKMPKHVVPKVRCVNKAP